MKALVYSLRSMNTVAKKSDIEDTATIICCVADIPTWALDAPPAGASMIPA